MKKILVFGCSKNAITIQRIISEMSGCQLIGFVDNDSTKWGKEYLGKKVISPDEMTDIYQESDVHILIGNFHYEETYSQVVYLIGTERVYLNLDEFLLRNQELLGATGKDLFQLNGYGIKLKEKNEYLLICNAGLPCETDLYRKAFVLQRLIAYRRTGMKIDTYGLVKNARSKEYLFSNTKIYEGDIVELRNLLRQVRYKKILVHFMDESIYLHLNYIYGEKLPQVITWSHGYDILKWDRRRFNYSEADVKKEGIFYEQKWKKKKEMWREIFGRENISCIFVSNWLKNISESDLGKQPSKWEIIPNYINAELFPYVPREASMRTKILLIKSHMTKMYANDIAAKVILELSRRACFGELFFSLYGDGKLFKEDFEELQERDFKNVEIYKKYLKQDEIAQLHKSNGVFLCPTRQDTQGVSMGEAMSSGLVVVTNAVAAVPEYIDDLCGVLCDNEDYVQMADAIEYLYYHPDVFLKMSKCAAQRVRQQCGYNQTIQKEIDFILG